MLEDSSDREHLLTMFVTANEAGGLANAAVQNMERHASAAANAIILVGSAYARAIELTRSGQSPDDELQAARRQALKASEAIFAAHEAFMAMVAGTDVASQKLIEATIAYRRTIIHDLD